MPAGTMGVPVGPVLATVVPVYNEAVHIEACLTSLLNQTLPPDQHMVLVLDGGSTDGTEKIVQSVIDEHTGVQFPSIELVSNPAQTVAHARNQAMQHLPGSVEFTIEMIGHAEVGPNHLEQRLEAWKACENAAGERLAAVGVQVVETQQTSTVAGQWIEGALASPLGRSGGQFSRFSVMAPTDVPAFVMHRREAVEAVNGWDTAFLTSQDSDLSMRLLKAGYVLYRHPLPSVTMHKRATLAQWWKMGHRYGFWRTKVVLKHPIRAKWQEYLPLLGAVLTMTLFVINSPTWMLPPMAYGSAMVLAGLFSAASGRGPSSLVGVPLCLVMLHASFSLGLLDGLVRNGRASSDRD